MSDAGEEARLDGDDHAHGALHAALDALLDLDVDGLDDGCLEGQLRSLGRAQARLAAAKAQAVAEWDRRALWRSNGAVRPKTRLANEWRVSEQTAYVELRRARKLRLMPHTFAALAQGDISVDHVDALGRANHGDRVNEFRACEKELVEACVVERFATADRRLRYWRQCVDPNGEGRAGEQLVKDRSLWWRRMPCGSISGGFRLDPVNAAIFTSELNHRERQLYLGELGAHGEPIRSVSQRRADAAVEMATRSKATPQDGQRPRPLYTVLVGYETFAGRICELDDGTVIAPGLLLGGLSEADIERVVFAAPDRVISVSQRRRFTGALRRAIQVRDRHCQHPSGCDVPASDCDVDHIVPWPLGRDTSQSNGRLACTSHNRLPETNAPRRDGGGGVERGRPPPGS